MRKAHTAALAALCILSACSGSNESNTTLAQSPAAVPAAPAPAAATAAPATVSEVTISKSDTGKTKNTVFLVKNTAEPSIDRGGYSTTKPEDNQKYIAVQVWVKNVSDKEITLAEHDIKVVDQNDAEFAEEKGFTEHRKKPILMAEGFGEVTLKPGQSKSGWITFTTDIGSKAKKLVYENVTVNL